MSRPAVSVVIPSWNGREYLDVVLPSLRGQTLGVHEVVVIDNGSSDGSTEHLRSEYPEVRVVSLDCNVGFAAAVNRGVAAARGEMVAVVNNDLELDPRWLEEIVAALRDHPEAASATGKMLFYDRRELIDGAGDFTSWYAVSAPRGRGEVDRGQYDAPEPVFSACGGAALYRRVALEAVGPFDEDFFAYAEDVDWGFRAQLAGWTCRYAPGAVAFHMGAATSTRIPGFARYLFFRNTLALAAKNWPARALLRHAHRLLLYVAKSGAASLRGGWFGAWARGLRDFLVGLPHTLRKRRAVQASRRVGLDYLDTVVRADYPLESRILAFVDAAILNRR
jgi:GT2 family glycosyltransferase